MTDAHLSTARRTKHSLSARSHNIRSICTHRNVPRTLLYCNNYIVGPGRIDVCLGQMNRLANHFSKEDNRLLCVCTVDYNTTREDINK